MLIVNQASNKAIISWQNFNIDENQYIHFQQPTGGIALNHVSPGRWASLIYNYSTRV